MQHQSSQVKHSTSTEEIHQQTACCKKYVKITDEVKETFLKLIIQSNLSIKKASEALRINYSSAKAILSYHKKTFRNNKINVSEVEQNSKRSSYKSIACQNLKSKVRLAVTCSVGGKSLISLNVPKTKSIFKPSILVPVPDFLNRIQQKIQH